MKKIVLCAALVAMSCGFALGQTFNTLVDFNETNGFFPEYVSLVQGTDGLFYGTTSINVFTMNAAGSEKTLYAFSGPDGYSPGAGLVLGNDGLFRGTTSELGANNYGTAFEIATDGTLTTLFNFGGTDGSRPFAAMVQATSGNFYGTTEYGGSGSGCNSGCGTIFKITPDGTLTTVHNFSYSAGGGYGPDASLIQATDGSLYGTTAGGGFRNQGTIFRITLHGDLVTLYSFKGSDGENPVGALLQASDGNLYGVTEGGGMYGFGTIFRLTPSGTFMTLHNFDITDGILPMSGVIQGTDGNLYGTTSAGGNGSNCGCGTLFSITTSGTLVTLHNFNFTDGKSAEGGLFQATNGLFYGTTLMGGLSNCDYPYGCGTIFSLDMGLPPFVSFVQPAGRVGRTGGVLGQGFTGTTSVSVNGTSARFTVVSDTYLTTTIPPGATTGFVTVNTPTGILTSNVVFRVIP